MEANSGQGTTEGEDNRRDSLKGEGLPPEEGCRLLPSEASKGHHGLEGPEWLPEVGSPRLHGQDLQED